MAQVSVIICAFDNEETIGNAIESAMSQTFSDVEIIVVDDASADATSDIARIYAQQDSRISVVKHEKRQGMLAMRRTGLLVSHALHVLFLPASNTMGSTAIEAAIRSASQGMSIWVDCIDNFKSCTTQMISSDVNSPNLIELLEDYRSCEDEAHLPLAIARLSCRCPTFIEIRELLKRICTSDFPPVQNQSESIAQYYYRLGNGGAERVMTELSALFLSKGKRSMIFAGCDPDEDSYPLENGVRFEVLKEFLGEHPDPSTIFLRLDKLRKCLRESSVDAYICHQWISSQSIWDLLLCKALGIRFVLVMHGVFSFSLVALPLEAHFWAMPYVVALCDAVVCLSEANRYYYSKFNNNTFVLPNPLTEELRTWIVSNSADRHQGESEFAQQHPTLLWLGRFEPGKHPEDAIDVMKHVLDSFPDAKLLMVGKSEDEAYEASLRQKVEQSNLAQAIKFCGYSKDVRSYYQQADVFLFTSEMEGSPMVLMEAAASGVPVVMYDLPYLATANCFDWIANVPIGDAEAAASSIVEIIGDSEKMRTMSIAASSYAESLAQFDLSDAWNTVLSCPARKENVFEAGNPEGVFWDTFFEHGLKRDLRHKDIFDAMQHGAESADAVRREFEESISWKVGRLVTALPRKILRNN